MSTLSDPERGRHMLAIYTVVRNAVRAGLDEHDARNEAELGIGEAQRELRESVSAAMNKHLEGGGS